MNFIWSQQDDLQNGSGVQTFQIVSGPWRILVMVLLGLVPLRDFQVCNKLGITGNWERQLANKPEGVICQLRPGLHLKQSSQVGDSVLLGW